MRNDTVAASLLHAGSADGFPGATPMILTRVARTHVDALRFDDALPRLVVVGTAGSGKTRLLRRIAVRLQAAGRPSVWVTPYSDIPGPADDAVLIVDDAHLLGERAVAAIHDRVRADGTGVLLATRPWPTSEALRRLCAELEQTQAAVVLGRVTRADVVDQLAEDGRHVDARCLDDILELTGQLTWLVSEALSLHEDAACDDADAHPAIREELRDLIAHRIAGVDEALRAAIETACLSPRTLQVDDGVPWSVAGHARGLLQRNGRPAPVVLDTVRATTPIDRLIELYADTHGAGAEAAVREVLGGAVHDARVATALLSDGDAVLRLDPRRAGELYRAAGDAGADPVTVAVRRATAQWLSGAVDAAAADLDAASIEPGDAAHPAATAIASAVWAARGDMRMSAAVWDDAGLGSVAALAHATTAAVGAADPVRLAYLAAAPPARTGSSTVAVAHELVTRGLRSTLEPDARTCLNDLVRASEMYTASGSSAPAPELPAVLATLTALCLGEFAAAHTVIESAVRGGHGGAWARPRLLLWQAWVAIQRERPHEAEAAVRGARDAGIGTARERVLADAIEVALVRRYADPAALLPAWRRARESILRTRFDLFSLLPLGEFAMSAAQLGDLERIRPHLDEAFAAVDRLDAPPMWAAPLHWAGLHCSILQNRPDDLTPHARALLAAAPHTRLARMMAAAGRVWTDVLTGKVDADAIEKAALGLASVGLAWDGARLAGQGAARAEDRRVIGRLLACARRLHPREDPEQSSEEDAATEVFPAARGEDLLSHREREVAALVLQGKTYAEIGQSIFISPRTAEHHIARIRRRLGATSRSDLIAKLRLVLEQAAGADDLLTSGRRDVG